MKKASSSASICGRRRDGHDVWRYEHLPAARSCDRLLHTEQIVDVAEKIVTIQRDYGNRSVRKYARFKYTVDRLGLDWIKDELHNRLGWKLQEARPYTSSIMVIVTVG